MREECYAQALAGLIDAQHRQPLAAHWGDGTISSSDAQFFRAGGRGEVGGLVNLQYGQEPGVKFYTHLSDQFGPFHTKVIDATANGAPHVLDGLLYHQSSLSRTPADSLKEKRLYTLPGMMVPPELVSLVAGAINLRAISDHWFERLRLATLMFILANHISSSMVSRSSRLCPGRGTLHFKRLHRQAGQLRAI